MSQDILKVLLDKPQDIFKLFKAGTDDDESINFFNTMTKTLLDPLTKQFSVLDEIYVEGLDSTQVFGQSKMVLEGVGEDLMSTKISELKEQYGEISEEEEDEEEEEEKDEEDEQDQENEVDQDEEEEFHDFEDASAQEDESDSKTLNEESEVSEGETNVPSEDESEPIEPIEPKKDAFGLNDGFFDIDEFNKQIVALENEDANDDGEEIDFFGDLSDDEDDKSDDEQMAYYDDFYDKPGTVEKVAVQKEEDEVDEEDQEDQDEEEPETKFDDAEYENAVGSAMLDLFDEEEEEKPKKQQQLSSYEKQQQQIQSEIAKLEAELVADKKWTMKGEVQSKDRPQDSLLDDSESANLEFDRTAKPVPVITEEVTETLEDLIRRRIKEDEFDDLPKRIVTDISKFHNRKAFELSEQKSTKSLAELYEDDYKGIDAQQDDLNEETKKQHDEISELFTSITHKLDSLSSAHFVPKPHQFKSIDIKVNDTAASISMEDAQPLHVSSESRLAPQEIYKIGDDRASANGKFGRLEVQLKSGLSYSKDELSREDKQRLRRANKRKKSKHFNERKQLQEQQMKEDASNPNKRQKVGEVIDTLSKAKNVTVIGKKGQLTDVKGALKKDNGPQTSNNFKL